MNDARVALQAAVAGLRGGQAGGDAQDDAGGSRSRGTRKGHGSSARGRRSGETAAAVGQDRVRTQGGQQAGSSGARRGSRPRAAADAATATKLDELACLATPSHKRTDRVLVRSPAAAAPLSMADPPREHAKRAADMKESAKKRKKTACKMSDARDPEWEP